MRIQSAILTGSVLLSVASASPQQFTAGLLPGGSIWSEGVCAADIDLDGDLDLMIANGDGFSSAGAKRQNVILRNQLVETGTLGWTNESVARLGANVSNAKLVMAADVNADGYPDLLYVNGFNTDVPFLYINRGAAQPGFFDLESMSRGLTEVLNSAGAQFGDVDDDGDLDLVIADAGPNLLSGPGSTPRMYLNDGAGFFTDASAQLNAPTKTAQQDVNLVDMDNDWDLDVMIANRATNAGGTHYLLINDGTGNFTDQSTLLPTTSGLVYEAEMGDLDGDLDRDFFFLSLSGFREGTVRNELAETGSLGFTLAAVEPGTVDDNEAGLFDFDTDGDYDVLVGSLGNRERMYRNDGTLDLVPNNVVIEAVGDSTLDLTIGDFDNDGDYDFVTAQGESGNFTNRLYTNSGPADDLAPRVIAVDVPAAPRSWPVTVRGRVQDQVLDDGESYVTASALYARVSATIHEVVVTAGGFAPATIAVNPGDRIRFIASGIGATQLEGAGESAWTREFDSDGHAERVFVAGLIHTVTAAGVAGSCVVTTAAGANEQAALHYGNALYSARIQPLPPGPTDRFAVVIRAEDWVGNVGYSDSSTSQDPDAQGVPYCDPVLNSSGGQARIVLRGSPILADQSLLLEAWSLPTSSFGFFLASRTQGEVAVSQGTFCLGQPFGRFSNFVQNSGTSGSVSLPMPFQSLPSSVTFLAGDTWNFTYWFRDANPSLGANFTDGVELIWR